MNIRRVDCDLALMLESLSELTAVGGWLGFIAVMVFLAAVPSTSVALVLAHTTTDGLRSGLRCAFGIAVADGLLVFVAMSSAAIFVERAGSQALGLGLLAVGIVIAVAGIIAWLGRRGTSETGQIKPNRHASFVSGFLLTFVDVKALGFYFLLVPLLFSSHDPSASDIALVVLVTMVCVGSVKAAFALGADKLLSGRLAFAAPRMRAAAPLLMAIIGVLAAARGGMMVLGWLI